MDTSKYKALYLQETNEHISGIEAGLLALEKGTPEKKAIDDLFRHFHSIKGMSASMGYAPIMKLAHAEEDLLDRIRSKGLQLTPEMTSALFECTDKLKSLVKCVEADEPLDAEIGAYTEKLKSAIEGRKAEIAAPEAPKAEEELKLSNVMKVEGRVFDDLLALVGDLFMALSSFKSLSHETRSIAFKDGVHMLGKSVNNLHNNILSARMLPIEDLTAGLPRVIRDMTQKTGKEVELKLEGADLSLDRAILEGLGSPMVHIIRNSVDHGIELPDERILAGKKPAGLINIKAYGRKDRVIIEISDDGRGIDVEKLKAKSIARGVSAEKIRSMSVNEILMLVCLPGLSLAAEVTETSGRGVGMDVVKASVEALGGTLQIDSAKGAGTKITLALPRTTSIIKGLLVTVGDELFLMPISKIEKVVEVKSELASGSAFLIGGDEIPLLPLSKIIGMDRVPEREHQTVIIAESGLKTGGDEKQLVGIVVDDFMDEIDAYIKPLLPPISKLWGISGITVMGDGRPVFLLDLPLIISKGFASGF